MYRWAAVNCIALIYVYGGFVIQRPGTHCSFYMRNVYYIIIWLKLNLSEYIFGKNKKEFFFEWNNIMSHQTKRTLFRPKCISWFIDYNRLLVRCMDAEMHNFFF